MIIEEISKINKNDKIYYKLRADGKSFSCWDSSDGFKQLENGEIIAGYDAKIEFSEKKGEYMGKPITFRNIISFEDIKEGKPVDKVEKTSGTDWAAKGRRITRMSCLARSMEFFELNKERMKEDFPGVISEQAVINVAKKFEKEYVYGDEK